MNNNIEADVDHLISSICSTPEYQDYMKWKSELSKDPALFSKVNTIREDYFRLYTSTPDEELSDAALEFTDKYEDDCQEPMVYGFLQSEAAFCSIMRQAMDRLMTGLNF